MTIAQTEKFYKQDKNKYRILKNKELLNWLKSVEKKGYHCIDDINYLQELINNIAIWYEIKYPERTLEEEEGTIHTNITFSDDLSNEMNIYELMYRLTPKELSLILCYYSSNGGGLKNIYNEKGEIIGQKSMIFIPLIDKKIANNQYDWYNTNIFFLVHADRTNGKVEVDNDLKEVVNTSEITLEELLFVLKNKYNEDLNLSGLEKCVYQHNCDIELREKILQLVALKLLYSKRTTPERGYKRARYFIEEFNNNFNLNLSSKEIDNAISKNIKEKSCCKIKKLLKKES